MTRSRGRRARTCRFVCLACKRRASGAATLVACPDCGGPLHQIGAGAVGTTAAPVPASADDLLDGMFPGRKR